MRLSLALISLVFVILLPRQVTAQTTSTRLSGTAYIDFVHYLDSSDENLRGHSGFTYRRMYATADFDLSDAFSARIRLSADQGTADARGPDVYIKDAFVRWQWHDQHQAAIGVLPPPLFETSESVWGYRGLEEVLVDLSGLASSRDVGLRIGGALNQSETLRYGLMVANNSDTRPEADRFKRAYGQIEGRFGTWVATIGANYAGYGDFRRDALMFNGVLGLVAEAGRVGIDWYIQQTEFAMGDTQTNAGISLFGEFPVLADWSLVGRVDRYSIPTPPVSTRDFTFGIIGVSYQPIRQIQIVPNLYWLQPEGADHDDARLRLTVIANM